MQEQNKPVNNPAVEEKKRSLWQEAWRRFRKKPHGNVRSCVYSLTCNYIHFNPCY